VKAILFSALILTLGAAPALEPQGLKAEWNFAESSGTTAADSSGNAATGTLTGGAVWTMGKVGVSVCLDGVNDYVALPANLTTLQSVGAATVAGWIKLSAMPGNGVFREIASFSVNAAGPTGMSRLAFAVRGDGTAADLFAGGRSTDSEAQQTATGDANIPLDTWAHVAAVVDYAGNSIRIYRNGTLLVTQAVTFSQPATPATPSTNSALGAQDDGSSNFFPGCLDEFRVYGRALSASEIERLATGDGLKAQWKMDEGAGGTAADSSYNEYTGTLQGPAWAAGQHEGALSFDGVDDRVDLGSSLNVLRNVNAATVTAWIKPASTIAAGQYRELVSISVNAGSPTGVSRVALALKGDGTAGAPCKDRRCTREHICSSLADRVACVPWADGGSRSACRPENWCGVARENRGVEASVGRMIS
jgi:hypothetical protein